MIKRRRLKPKDVRKRIRDYLADELGEKLELRLCQAGSEFQMPANLKAHLPAIFVRLDGWSNSHDSKIGVRRTVYRLEVAYLRLLAADEEAQEHLIDPAAEIDELFCRDDYTWPFSLDTPEGYTIVSALAESAEFPDPEQLDEMEIRLEHCSTAVLVTVDTQKQ